MFKLVEIERWLGLSDFEIFSNLLSILTFTILLAFKLAGHLPEKLSDWSYIFIPLYVCDIYNGYFCIIVAIRMYLDNDNQRRAFQRFLWSFKIIGLTTVFKYLLCLKLSGAQNLDYSEVFAPVFVLLQLISIRACQLPNDS